MNTNTFITVVAADNVKLKVKKMIANQCSLLHTMMDLNPNETEINITQYNADILKKIFDNYIIVVAANNVELVVKKVVANQCIILRTMMELSPNETEIDMTQYDAVVLKKIFDYCNFHRFIIDEQTNFKLDPEQINIVQEALQHHQNCSDMRFIIPQLAEQNCAKYINPLINIPDPNIITSIDDPKLSNLDELDDNIIFKFNPYEITNWDALFMGTKVIDEAKKSIAVKKIKETQQNKLKTSMPNLSTEEINLRVEQEFAKCGIGLIDDIMSEVPIENLDKNFITNTIKLFMAANYLGAIYSFGKSNNDAKMGLVELCARTLGRIFKMTKHVQLQNIDTIRTMFNIPDDLSVETKSGIDEMNKKLFSV